MMMGAGIGAAAAGIGLMGEGFGKMFEHADADKLSQFAGIIVVLTVASIALGYGAALAGPGMAILVLGLTGLAIAMGMMEGSLTAFSQFTGNLSALAQDSSGLTQVASEIVAIADAINTLPLMPTLALSTAFEHARASATTAAQNSAPWATTTTSANQIAPKVEVKVFIEDVEVKPAKIETAINDVITSANN